jgi:hypothetical protein
MKNNFNKIEFITRLEKVKEELPSSIVPVFLKKFKEYDKLRNKVTAVVQGRKYDEDILNKLEILANYFKS